MKIFLTGGTGFIGGHFLNGALAAGHQVFALRRPGGKTRIPLLQEPDWLEGGLDQDWTATLSRCEALVHLAAAGVTPQKAGWDEMFEANVRQSLHLWRQAVKSGVKRLVICGSCFEYGRTGERYEFIPADAPLAPAGGYAASKAAATMAALGLAIESQVETILLRPFHVFGEGQHSSNFWPSLQRAARAGEDFPMTLGKQVRDFIPVGQAASAFVAALTRTDLRPGEPLIENLGTGQPQTLHAFAEHWWRTWGAKGKLLPGVLPYRKNEVMRYVPLIP